MDTLRITKTLLLWILIYLFSHFPNCYGNKDCYTIGLEINIKKKGGTESYIYNYYGNVGTYTALKGFSIVLVKHGNKVIWEASNSDESAFHVKVEGLGHKGKIVTINHSNGQKTKFRKIPGFCGLFGYWMEERTNPIYVPKTEIKPPEINQNEEEIQEIAV